MDRERTAQATERLFELMSRKSESNLNVIVYTDEHMFDLYDQHEDEIGYAGWFGWFPQYEEQTNFLT